MMPSETLTRFDPMTVDLADLVETLTVPGVVPLRDRYHNLRRYGHCFEGNELIDVLVARYGISRAQALRLGERMLAHDLIRHVLGEHDFHDAPLFYVFGNPDDTEDRPVVELSRAALVELARSMRARAGVRVSTNRNWLVDYPETFVGREAVDWIASQTELDRDGAINVGRALLSSNIIRHVLDEHDFGDNGRLYRFV